MFLRAWPRASRIYVLFQLVPAWLRTEGIDLATIGLFSLILLPFNLKFLWAPLMDRYLPPLFGRRTGWDADYANFSAAQYIWIGLVAAENSVGLIALVCLIVAFFQRVRTSSLTLIAVSY